MRRSLRNSWCGWTALAALVLLLYGELASPVWAQGFSNPTSRDSTVGYVDSAIPGTQFRVIGDAADHNNSVERGEMFYPQDGPFQPGPAQDHASLNYQEVTAALEVLLVPRLSVFAEIPVRFVQFDIGPSSSGLSDISGGFKYAFIYRPDLVTTFQLRAYAPTGNSSLGLGNHHTTLEPAFLLYKPFENKLTFEGEFRDWIPIDGTGFASDIIRIGGGLSYPIYQTERLKISPVVESVSWLLLGGEASKFEPAVGEFIDETATGQFISNLKMGLRFNLGDWSQIYMGYGRSLTGDRWYENIYRFEVRLLF